MLLMSKPSIKSIEDQLRQLMDESGLTKYRLAKETGINEAALGKFYHGQRGLSMKALNALGKCLQLKVIMLRKPDRKE